CQRVQGPIRVLYAPGWCWDWSTAPAAICRCVNLPPWHPVLPCVAATENPLEAESLCGSPTAPDRPLYGRPEQGVGSKRFSSGAARGPRREQTNTLTD